MTKCHHVMIRAFEHRHVFSVECWLTRKRKHNRFMTGDTSMYCDNVVMKTGKGRAR